MHWPLQPVPVTRSSRTDFLKFHRICVRVRLGRICHFWPRTTRREGMISSYGHSDSGNLHRERKVAPETSRNHQEALRSFRRRCFCTTGRKSEFPRGMCSAATLMLSFANILPRSHCTSKLCTAQDLSSMTSKEHRPIIALG